MHGATSDHGRPAKNGQVNARLKAGLIAVLAGDDMSGAQWAARARWERVCAKDNLEHQEIDRREDHWVNDGIANGANRRFGRTRTVCIT